MKWAETLESLRSEDASLQQLFGGDGTRVRARNTPQYRRQLAEAAQFLHGVFEGRQPAYRLQEVMTTSDFPLLFADILDRQVLAKYMEWPSTWPALARRVTVRDFRNAKFFPPAYGGDDRLLSVPEVSEYPEAALNEQAAISYNVKKYGRRVPFSFEALINDDLNQLMDVPDRLARAARRTEQRGVTELFVDASGPHASFYTTGNKNIVNVTNGAVSTNPPLSIAALQDAMKVMAALKDEMGEPIFMDALTLVVPPALEITAKNILNATQLWLTQAGGVTDVQNTTATPSSTGQQMLQTANWMRNKLTLVVDPYIPMTALTANGSSSWFLFGNPTQGRPGLIVAFLRGYEQPQVWIKESDARQAGGGPVDPMAGSFDTDSITYRIRHIVGFARIDPKATVASNGSGA